MSRKWWPLTAVLIRIWVDSDLTQTCALATGPPLLNCGTLTFALLGKTLCWLVPILQIVCWFLGRKRMMTMEFAHLLTRWPLDFSNTASQFLFTTHQFTRPLLSANLLRLHDGFQYTRGAGLLLECTLVAIHMRFSLTLMTCMSVFVVGHHDTWRPFASPMLEFSRSKCIFTRSPISRTMRLRLWKKQVLKPTNFWSGLLRLAMHGWKIFCRTYGLDFAGWIPLGEPKTVRLSLVWALSSATLCHWASTSSLIATPRNLDTRRADGQRLPRVVRANVASCLDFSSCTVSASSK